MELLTLIRIMRTLSSLLIIGDLGNKDSFKISLTKCAFPSYVCEHTTNANGLDTKVSMYSRSDDESLISENFSIRRQ